jgi:C1A family cysteine protease
MYAERHAAVHASFKGVKDLPPSYDCLALVTPIKDQGQCGSCWDFSGTCVDESANIKAGFLDNTAASQLSEQYTLDACDGSNGGCGGDDNTTVTQDAKTGGLPLTSVYGPYTASESACKWQPSQQGGRVVAAGTMLYTLSDWGYVGSQSGVPAVEAIKVAMIQYGAIGCAVAADDAFEAWGNNSPSKDKPFTGSGSQNIDHDIILCGWDDSVQAWLLRNSWGTSWGIGGYMWISYSANLVGYEAIWGKAGTPVPYTPTPNPDPTPTRRMLKLLDHYAERYQNGTPAERAAIERELAAQEVRMG